MKTGNNGSIVFESRYSEIEPLMEIFEEWLKDHPTDDKAEIAEQFLKLLDFLHMSW